MVAGGQAGCLHDMPQALWSLEGGQGQGMEGCGQAGAQQRRCQERLRQSHRTLLYSSAALTMMTV